jgi:hypothetical protein
MKVVPFFINKVTHLQMYLEVMQYPLPPAPEGTQNPMAKNTRVLATNVCFLKKLLIPFEEFV